MIRIGFFGTPHIASHVLSDLISHGDFEVAFVVTNPDKPFGRDQHLQPSPVKSMAVDHDIPVLQPEKIRGNEQFLNHIRSYNCEYYIVVAYGKILPLELLQIPQKMCINVHGSILPKYRGASPIQSALLHGENETGVTIMQMSEGMDEGDMILVEKIPIGDTETSGTLFEKFEQVSGTTLIRAITGLEDGTLSPIPQDHHKATYCKKIEKEDGLIDWSKSAIELYHMWQAYTPWPGIYTMYEGKRLLLEKVALFPHYEKKGNEAIGQVTRMEDREVEVICGEGILTLEQVKLEGKKSQHIKDFVNGNQNFISYQF